MKLLVMGSTGRTGRHVLEQARRRGHEVTAFTRRPAALCVSGLAGVIVTSSRSVVATRPWVAVTLARSVFRNAYVDLVRAETIVAESELDWTIVRATRLTDGPPTGTVHIDRAPDATGGASTLTRADYAMACLDALEDPATIRSALGVCGPDRRVLRSAA